MGADLLSRLRDALDAADLDRFSELLGEAPQDHAPLAERLATLAEDFDYDTLQSLLSEATVS